MTRTRRRTVVAIALLLVGVAVVAAQLPRDRLIATAARPAELRRDSLLGATPATRPDSLTLMVVGYLPAKQGTVTAVVHLWNSKTGERREIGRFGVFPDAAFTAGTPADAQRFGFMIGATDLEWLRVPDVKLTVSLEPTAGKGEGASLTLSGAELK